MTKRRIAVRLTVIQTRVTCPYGRNDGLGGRYLQDCYLDSVTPQHPCVDPKKTGAARCPAIRRFVKRYGWRTYRVAPEVTTVNEVGQPHQQHPLAILYTPLNVDGTRWMATNRYTGQRFEAVLHAEHPHRRTPEDDHLESPWRRLDLSKVPNGGVVDDRAMVDPIWNHVPPLNDWRCSCSTCKKESSMTIHGRRPIGWPQDGFPTKTPPPLDPATVPSASADESQRVRRIEDQRTVPAPVPFTSKPVRKRKSKK